MDANAGARRFEPVDAARRRPDGGQRASAAILELDRRIRRAMAARGFAQPTLAADHVHLSVLASDARRKGPAAAMPRARRPDPAKSPPPKARATGAVARPVRL